MNSNSFTTLRRASLGVFSVITAALTLTSASAQPADPAPATATPTPGAAPAQDGGRAQRTGGGGGNTTQRGGNFGSGLNFDEKQRELLQEARLVNTEELRKLNEKLADAQKEFVKAVVAEKYDETVVRAKADAIGKIQAEILALNGKSFATVSPTLKLEQREALEGNARIGIAIINPAVGFGVGGPGGNFAVGGAAGFGGGRGGGEAGFGGAGGPGGGGGRGNFGGDRGAQGAPGAPGAPGGGGNTRRRGGENPGQ